MRPLAHRFAVPLVDKVDHQAVAAAGYFSQIGQDLLLDRHVFGGRRGGVFVDVGAHDGVTFSNTVFFERERGWTGLCIEPNPEVYPLLASSRNVRTVRAAVATSEGTAPFRVVAGRSMASRIEASVGWRNGRDDDGETDRIVQVAVRRLDELLAEAGLDAVDLLSIDVEGSEASVIDSIDLKRFGVRAALIENNHRSWSVPKRMYRQGYQPVLRLGQDELYLPFPTLLVPLPGIIAR